ncbi:hypothetical protein G6F64_013700 [Rhizopus arrhizus]|uniref:Uncharacterized protein n=1 Tax=Rhizopus oryzae TaxID=64495 RepID=A0A9P7BK17_RHIOR|nr:hypothetical protein G6F64_013700 [Rhizopus arrhizus]
MGKIEGGCIRNESQHSIACLLESPPGPGSSSNRRIQPTMASNRTVSSPPMETDTVSTQEIQERQSEEGGSHNTKLANTVLVATGTANYKDSTYGHTIEQGLELDRLAIIQQYQNSQELKL